jgi:septal ring factor EnvC (AmiA/AmiB activator)
MGSEILIGLVGTVCTGAALLIPPIVQWLRARSETSIAAKKADEDAKANELQRAVTLYRDIAESLRKDMDKLMEKLDHLEEDRLKCREENAALKTQVQILTEKVAKLEASK